MVIFILKGDKVAVFQLVLLCSIQIGFKFKILQTSIEISLTYCFHGVSDCGKPFFSVSISDSYVLLMMSRIKRSSFIEYLVVPGLLYEVL